MMTATAPAMSPAALLRHTLTDPTAFAATLTIMDKQARLTRLHHNRMQRDFFSKYSYGKRATDIIVKYRQGGATTGILGEISRVCWTAPTRALSLMNVDKNTANMREIAQRMYDHWPRVIEAGVVKVSKPQRKVANATTTRYDNNSRWVMDTAGSPDAARGSTVDIIHLSECAFYTHSDAIIAGALQAAGSARWKVWESTTNGAQGKFFEIASQAMDGDPDYRLHFYPWWWADEYRLALEPDEVITPEPDEADLMARHGLTLEQIKWRRAKQRELGVMFPQEYPESVETCFLQSGTGFFGNTNGFWGAALGAVPVDGLTYVGGIDWGQANDFTVFSIGAIETGEQVYRLRVNRREYNDIIADIVNLCRFWGVKVIEPEKNSMSMQVAALRDALSAAGLSTNIRPFTTTNESKRKLIMSLYSALHEKSLKLIPDPVARGEYNAFQSTQTANGAYVYGAAPGMHDDCVMGDGLMWRAMNRPAGIAVAVR